MRQPVIARDPEVMGGTPVFHGTRAPVQTLLDYLEAGESIDDFLDGFPSVTREQVVSFLEQATDQQVPLTIEPELIPGRRESRKLVIAAGLTDDGIDALIKRAQMEVEPLLSR
jgi:uncharacterized protein (DUF433 family)